MPSKKIMHISLKLAFIVSLVINGFSEAAMITDQSHYSVEMIAQYSSENMGWLRDIAIDPDGVIYITHRGSENANYLNGSITRIEDNVVQTRWVDNLNRPSRMVWGGGTQYGNNMYFVEAEDRVIHKLNSDGTYSVFSDISTMPFSIDIDRNGSYGGDMFSASIGTDRIYRISTNGSDSIFSYWPGLLEGNVRELKISPNSRYGGSLFVIFDQDDSSIGDPFDGIYKIDTNGNATQFGSNFEYVRSLEFDPFGLMFDNDLFAIGQSFDTEGTHIFRIFEDGSIEDMGQVGWAVKHMAFGPDGSMYYIKDVGDTTQVYKVSEVPEPATFVIFGIGGLLLTRKKTRVL